MNYFFEPVNLNMWNLFDKVSNIGHVEAFYATKDMKIGDIMFLHVGSQDSDYNSGVYAVGKIISMPHIYMENEDEYCYKKLSVKVEIIKYSRREPLVNYNDCKKYINQFRSHHMLEQEKGKMLYDYIFANKSNIDIEKYNGRKILYCRIGWMNSYNGLINGDKIKNGGSYNRENIGHEIYNFSSYEGKYYGYVQPVNGSTINIDRISGEKEIDYIDDVLVVWVATRDYYGQVVIGWYKDARVYRYYQTIPNEVLAKRDLKTHFEYSISSDDATLILPIENRTLVLDYKCQSNVWYGNEEINNKVYKFIESFDINREIEINKINENLSTLVGQEKEIITKARINQGFFRNTMLRKYKHCCLCGISNENLLVASHIKPWSKSDENEKVSEYNGLLLCSMHDKLFDLGYISFNDDGTILVSNELNKVDRIFSNIDEKRTIKITADNIPFIRYHRENIFKK